MFSKVTEWQSPVLQIINRGRCVELCVGGSKPEILENTAKQLVRTDLFF